MRFVYVRPHTKHVYRRPRAQTSADRYRYAMFPACFLTQGCIQLLLKSFKSIFPNKQQSRTDRCSKTNQGFKNYKSLHYCRTLPCVNHKFKYLTRFLHVSVPNRGLSFSKQRVDLLSVGLLWCRGGCWTQPTHLISSTDDKSSCLPQGFSLDFAYSEAPETDRDSNLCPSDYSSYLEKAKKEVTTVLPNSWFDCSTLWPLWTCPSPILILRRIEWVRLSSGLKYSFPTLTRGH